MKAQVHLVGMWLEEPHARVVSKVMCGATNITYGIDMQHHMVEPYTPEDGTELCTQCTSLLALHELRIAKL